MPQRASQRKFGKSLKLHLAKQKKQRKLMYEKEKSEQRKRTYVLKKREEKASRRTRTKLSICLRMCVYKKPQSETGNKRLREPHKTRSAKRTSAAEQEREQRTHANPQKTAPLSPL